VTLVFFISPIIVNHQIIIIILKTIITKIIICKSACFVKIHTPLGMPKRAPLRRFESEGNETRSVDHPSLLLLLFDSYI